MIRQVLIGVAVGILACTGGCSGPPSPSQVASSPTPQSTDIATKVHACQTSASTCDNACDDYWKTCVGTPGSGPPPQHCGDDMYACKDTCQKQYSQCVQ